VCVRCGTFRTEYRQICPSCGHRPEGEGLLVAWLLSEEHLPAADVDAVAARVRSGEVIRPSEKMLDRARHALGAHVTSDPGLSTGQRLMLLATSLLITPLVGWVLWYWWRKERPRAALQALGLSLPASVAMTVLVLWWAAG
jgi:hypothetical protein